MGVWSPDPILSIVAPVGLASSVGTALVVDLTAAQVPGTRTLATLAAEGPKLSELSPTRRGVAMLAGGRISTSAAVEIIDRLATHWPALVVRLTGPDPTFANVPVIPLFPGRLVPRPDAVPGVWQPVVGGAPPPGPGPVLPRLRPGTVRRILAGRLPRQNRWVTAWRPIWEMPWA